MTQANIAQPRFQKPITVLQAFGIPEGSTVIDLGAGSGFYTFAAAAKTGKEGRVYAVDIQPELLASIKSNAESLGLKQVQILAANLEKPQAVALKDNSVDIVIAANFLFQASNSKARANMVKEIYRLLRPQGRLLVVEWQVDPKGHVDEKGQENEAAIIVPKSLCISSSNCRNLFTENGFIYDKEIDAGSHHYAMILHRNG